MGLLQYFLNRKKNTRPIVQTTAIPQEPHWSAKYTYGAHIYRRADEDSTVCFRDPTRGIKRMVVDKQGHIRNFPGITLESLSLLDGVVEPDALKPLVRFRTDFDRDENGAFRMLWQVQPDGRYWEDEDGFGGTSDEEVQLCAFVDENGVFTAPFRLHRIGQKYYD